MAAGVPARLTAAAGRKFGLTVGFAFLAIGLLLYWRGKTTKAAVVLSLAALLIAAALVAPTQLGPVERGWMALAHAMSKVTTPIFMGIVYFLVIAPIGFIRRRVGSPIVARTRVDSRWQLNSRENSVGERMEHQF